jgi:hypothetical protein
LEGFNRQKSPTKRHISIFGFQFVTNNIEHGWMIKDLVLSLSVWWLNLPVDDRHFHFYVYISFPVYNHHFGYKQKFIKKKEKRKHCSHSRALQV